MKKFFDISGEELQEIYAEEAFIADVQYQITKIMKEKNVSRSDLARRMKVSPASVSQMLGDEGANLTSRTIARIFFSLGEEPALCAKEKLVETALEYRAEKSGTDWLSIAGVRYGSWSAEGGDLPATPRSSAADGENVVWLQAYRKAA